MEAVYPNLPDFLHYPNYEHSLEALDLKRLPLFVDVVFLSQADVRLLKLLMLDFRTGIAAGLRCCTTARKFGMHLPATNAMTQALKAG